MTLKDWITAGGNVLSWLFNTVCKEHGEQQGRNYCVDCISEVLAYERERYAILADEIYRAGGAAFEVARQIRENRAQWDHQSAKK